MRRSFIPAIAMAGIVMLSGIARAQGNCDSYDCSCSAAATCDQCASVFDDCCEKDSCGSGWLITADALFLDRDDPSDGVLAFNTNDASQNIDAGDLNYAIQTGVDISIAKKIDQCRQWEVRYFGVESWDAFTGTATTPNDLLQFNAAVPVFVTAGDGMVANYASKLHNVEFNYGVQMRDWLGVSAGFRYLELDEVGSISLTGAAVPFDYATQTVNRLYGAQLGGHALLLCRNGFTLEANGKAGIYDNNAHHSAFTATNVATLTAVGSDDRTAFIGELDLKSALRLTDHLSLRGGYRLLWLDEVAVAPEQLGASDFNTGNGFDGSGHVFFHGAFAGLEWTR